MKVGAHHDRRNRVHPYKTLLFGGKPPGAPCRGLNGGV